MYEHAAAGDSRGSAGSRAFVRFSFAVLNWSIVDPVDRKPTLRMVKSSACRSARLCILRRAAEVCIPPEKKARELRDANGVRLVIGLGVLAHRRGEGEGEGQG